MNNQFDMFNGVGGPLIRPEHMKQMLNAKDHFFESEHEFSPVFSKEGNPLPHFGLPVLKTPLDKMFPDSFGFVFNPATMVAIDVNELEKGNYYLVHANGGKKRTITYNENDVEAYVLKSDANGKLNTVSVGDTLDIEANVPAGWIFYYGRQNPATHGGHILDEFQIGSQIDTEGFIILPHIYKGKDNKYDIKHGDNIAADCPTVDDLKINPKAGHGKWRVWYEDADDTLEEGAIKRPNGAAGVVYGKTRDSLRQATAKVISVVDMTSVPKDKTRLNTDYENLGMNMVGPMTNGFLPTYWDFWKFDFEATNNTAGALNKYKRKDEYNCKLIFALIGKR